MTRKKSEMSKKIRKIRRDIISNMPPKIFDLYANIASLVKGYPHRVLSIGAGEMIEIRDKEEKITICRRTRISLYKRGVKNRLVNLAKSYLLDQIEEPLSGAFIDCGANVGELGAFSRAHNLDYHAFEPEKREADCCDLNNYDGSSRTNRVGLWSEDGTLEFYSKPSSADSSLFETDGYIERHVINVRSLDSYVLENNLNRIAIIKIEAEGAEPEILSGAEKSLRIAKYVTVDCGFERGKAEESTLVPVVNLMINFGFEAVAWNRDRVTMLFRNTDQTIC